MSFFDRMRGKSNSEAKGSSATAKDRLKMVLTHDRIKVSPEKMKEMRAEIVAIIARYIPEIDPDSVDIAIEQSDRYQNKLVAEIPFTQERGKAPAENDGNDDLDPDSLNALPELDIDDDDRAEEDLSLSEDEIYLADVDTEMIYMDDLDTDSDDTIKSRANNDD